MTPASSTKSALAPSTNPTTFNTVPIRKTSCGTVCSSNSSCLLQKRKPINPLQASVRTSIPRTPSNAVKQRVLSAKLIKLRSIQSQLNDANFHLTELSRENRALKTLQNRQDKALRNYEGTNADLPRLIKSHEEETRVLHEKNRALKKVTKELAEQIKVKDEETNGLNDQLKHLVALSKDKHLEERKKLTEKLDEVNQRLKEHEQQVTVLNRKLLLETKNCRFKLNAEVNKHKLCQRELGLALMEIGRLNGILEGKNRTSTNNITSQLHRKKSTNLIGGTKQQTATGQNSSQSTGDLLPHAGTGSDITLAPIKSAMKPFDADQQPNIMASPAENIRARLSGNSDKDQVAEAKSRPSSVKLETLANKSVEENSPDNLTKTTPIPSLNQHTADYKSIQSSTNTILQNLKDADILDQKLRKSNRFTEAEPSKNDRDIVNHLWQSEYSGRKSKEHKKDTTSDITKRLAKYDFSDILNDAAEDVVDADVKLSAKLNANASLEVYKNAIFDRSKALVTSEEKTKLLATLRAIDNGDSVDAVVGKSRMGNSGDALDKLDVRTHTSENLMRELFGDT